MVITPVIIRVGPGAAPAARHGLVGVGGLGLKRALFNEPR